MESLADLKKLLETQFGPYIRDGRYKSAFDKAMESVQDIPPGSPKIDVFYLFLHQLVFELFQEIDRLNAKLRNGK